VAEPYQHAQGIGPRSAAEVVISREWLPIMLRALRNAISTITPTIAASPYAGEISTLRAPSRAVNPNVRFPTSLLGRLTLKADQHTDRKRDGDLDRDRARRKPRDLLKSE
jgi:hypothetical protein